MANQGRGVLTTHEIAINVTRVGCSQEDRFLSCEVV